MADKEKFIAYFKAIHDVSVETPELENIDGIALLDHFFGDLAELVNKYAGEADQLGSN